MDDLILEFVEEWIVECEVAIESYSELAIETRDYLTGVLILSVSGFCINL